MIKAMTSMTSHAGEAFAKSTPSGETNAPAMPATTPSLGTQVRLRMCVTKPVMDVGMMVNSEVAVEQMAGRPKPRRSKGTITVPPPIPNMPENTPMIRPHAIAASSISSTYSSSPRLRRISPVRPGSTLMLGMSRLAMLGTW